MARLLLAAMSTLVCGSLLCEIAAAQSVDLNRMFGNGVHAYFDGDIQGALETLNEAVEQGSTDPRVYYFRGLCRHQLGDVKAAETDFSTGARWERRSRMFAAINNSLERVQGQMRLELEAFRSGRRGSKPVATESELIQLTGNTPFASEIVDGQRPGSSPNLPNPAESNDPTLPFGGVTGELALPADKTDEIDLGDPVQSAPAASESVTNNAVEQGVGVERSTDEKVGSDPFGGDPPKAADPRTDDDPFEKGAEDPFGAKPSGSAPPAETADSTAGGENQVEDPFGAKPQDANKSDEDPFGEKPAQPEKVDSETKDPFGSDTKSVPPAESSKPAGDAKTDQVDDKQGQKKSEDPFSGGGQDKSKDEKKKDSDDPFGG